MTVAFRAFGTFITWRKKCTLVTEVGWSLAETERVWTPQYGTALNQRSYPEQEQESAMLSSNRILKMT